MTKIIRFIKKVISSFNEKLSHNALVYVYDDHVKFLGFRLSQKIYRLIKIIFLILIIYFLLFVFGSESLFFVLRRSTYIIVPLILVAFGGLYSERSGVVNIALEGIMIFGAFIGIIFLEKTQNSEINSQLLYLVAIIIAGAAGILFSLIHAFASINMKANQIISGTALNLLAPSFALFMIKIMYGGEDIAFRDNYFVRDLGFLSDIPVIGPIFFEKTYISTFYTLIILVVVGVILYRTRLGLRLRACGEHPHAADAAGINVKKMRYIGVMMSGLLAGIGGLVLIVPLDVAYRATASGYGFLALGVLISGQWKPFRIVLVAMFFGFMLNLSGAYSSIDFLRNLQLPDKLYSMLPFVVTLVVLIFTSKSSQAPKAAGEPYDQGKR